MDQVRSLQQKVLELSEQSGSTSGNSGPKSDCQTAQEINDGRILLVSNLPPTLATCDAVFFMFDRWFEYDFLTKKTQKKISLCPIWKSYHHIVECRILLSL